MGELGVRRRTHHPRVKVAGTLAGARRPAAPAGYSGTPLAKKLGIAAGCRWLPLHAPEDYTSWVAPLPGDVVRARRADATVDVAHLFVTRRSVLATQLARLREALRPGAALWVSWPKKASHVATDITEDTIRELALPLGWVDVKVCAVSEIWSGLKLVVRRELR
jgi:hypothetical protein